NGVGTYACIEEVIAVGATDHNDQKYDVCNHDLQVLLHESPATQFNARDPSRLDTRRCGSNSGELLDLWAPGVAIETARASSAGGGTEVNSGTSEAAPHVAGAWAVMKQRKPNASVDDIEAAFDATGVPITVGGVTRKRIDIDEALLELTDDPIAGPIDVDNQIPVALTPSGTIDTNQPTFTWSAITGADTYAVYAIDAAGERKVWNLVGAANAGCDSGTGTCSYTHPRAVFAEGEGGFWNVRTAHDQQHGMESNTLGFTVETSGTPVTPISSLEDTCQQGKAPFGNETLTAGDSVCLEDASNGRQRQMALYVSDDEVGGTLEIVMGHGSGDANLLHRFDSRPTREQYDQISESSGNEEKLIINHLSRGWHYIHVRANTGFSGVTLRASFQ
ncbi:MAG: S8 family serine peptidase, partial [Methylococcales bacterium]|nr:S8 family serine peptidase [Methylococcales bacterium]